MRIVGIADTHIPVAAQGLPKKVIAELKKSQLCLHAGDIIEPRVIDEINSAIASLAEDLQVQDTGRK